MRRTLLVLFALTALAACGTSRNARRPQLPSPRYYEAYYDGFYGPFIDGYWGRDERFFWYLGPDKVWRRDIQHHFVHGDPGPHFSWVRGKGSPRTNR